MSVLVRGYLRSVFSLRMLKKVSAQFLAVAGALGIFLGIADILVPNTLNFGYPGLLMVLGFSLLIALLRALPALTVSTYLQHPDTKITIKVGDLFKESAHLVIGFCDTFDTEIGAVVSGGTVQGQFLATVYVNDRPRLDRDLDQALANEQFQVDATKTKGKNKRYPIGTIAVIDDHARKFFCCAYSLMGSNLKADSDISNLWSSLQRVWSKAIAVGERKPIAFPVVGTNLARVQGITYSSMIKLLVLSYVIHSRMNPISKELIVVVHQSDLEKVDLLELKQFLSSLDQ